MCVLIARRGLSWKALGFDANGKKDTSQTDMSQGRSPKTQTCQFCSTLCREERPERSREKLMLLEVALNART